MGWGGGGRSTSCKGKLREKKSCTASSPEKMFLHTEKNIPTREMLTKKNSCSSKIPHSPITFLMVRPIRSTSSAVLFNVLHVKILICRTSFVFIIIISDCYLQATVAFLLQCTFETKYSLFVSLFILSTESVDDNLYCNRSNESY